MAGRKNKSGKVVSRVKKDLPKDYRYEFFELTSPEWERQVQETSMAWEAFKYYRDMPINRNLSEVARFFTGYDEDKFKGKYATIQAWSFKWKWSDRIRLYQSMLDAIYLEETKLKVKEMASRHAEFAENTLDALITPIKAYHKKYKAINDRYKIARLSDPNFIDPDDDIDEMKLSQLFNLVLRSAPLLPITADMERKSRGEATEISRTDVTSNGESIRPNINILVKGTMSPLMRQFEDQIGEVIEDE